MLKPFEKLTDVKANRDLIFLLVVGGLYALGIFLSNTFVNIYLWKQSGDYITIAVYNLGIYLFQPVMFILAGRMAKKVDRVIVLRIGVIFLSLFFLTVLWVGEEASTYNFLLGSLLGVGYGFYWLAYNVLTFEITEPETRDFFNGFFGVMQSFGGMISPVIAGFIIAKLTDDVGYTVIFAISFALFICAVICSFFLDRRRAEGDFYFKRVIMEYRHNKNWRHILHAHIFQGLREGIFLFVVSIWVFLVTKSELSLALFNFTLSGMSIIFYFLATMLIKPSRRKKAILVAGLILYVAIFIILFHKSYWQLMIYATVIGMAYPVLDVPYASLTYDVIGKAWRAKDLRVEYIVVRELFVNIGRVCSLVIFLIAVSLVSVETSIPVLLGVFGLGHLFIYVFVKDIYLHGPGKQPIPVKSKITDEKNR